MFGWDALNNKWNQWVLSYGTERQADLLGWLKFGGLSWQSMAILLLTAVGAVVVGIVVLALKQERQTDDAIVRSYQNFCRKLARRGLRRWSYEGPGDFAERVAIQRCATSASCTPGCATAPIAPRSRSICCAAPCGASDPDEGTRAKRS